MSEQAMTSPAESEPSAAVASPAPPAGGEIVGVFYGQLGGLLRAGMPLPEALRTLAVDARGSRFREALERAAAGIEEGGSAADAFRAEERQLGGLLGRAAAAAAASGRLPEMLSELSSWTLSQNRIKRRLKDGLTYPYAVLVLASAMGALAAWGLDINGQMLRTMQEMDLGGNIEFRLQATGLLLSAVVGIGVFLSLLFPFCWLAAELSTTFRIMGQAVLLRVPLAGSVCRALALSRLCGGAAILMKAGTSYHEAIGAAGRLTGYAPYERATANAADALAAGHPPDEAWRREPFLFPHSMQFILASAHAQGGVPEAFEDLGEIYAEESEARARLLALLLPPICLIGVGLMAACVLYSIVSPFLYIMERIGT